MDSPSDITIRAARPSDFDALDRIRTTAVRELAASHYDPEVIRDWSMAHDRALFEEALAKLVSIVAEKEGDVVGFGQLDIGKSEIRAVYVDPSVARTGVGRQLIEALETLALGAGLERLELRSSLNAVAFYERSGFQAIREVMHALRTGREAPCLLMAKQLGAASEGPAET